MSDAKRSVGIHTDQASESAGTVDVKADVAEIGKHVVVRHNQRRLGGDKYPGRKGIVVDENTLGRSDGGLWYVRLFPTSRAKERIESFWSRDLQVVGDEADQPTGAA